MVLLGPREEQEVAAELVEAELVEAGEGEEVAVGLINNNLKWEEELK